MLAPSNDDAGSAHGLFVHQLLHHIHKHGSCHDPDHVGDVLAGHGADAAHERRGRSPRRARCPIGAEPVGHEIEWARAHRGPPVFVATARLDAVWAHDGILDVRDYKTGRVGSYPVPEDPRARLQAWVAAPQAAALGLRLRLRYEHLAMEVLDDPEPWEPSDDELALDRGVSSPRRRRRRCAPSATSDGVADVDVCRYCAVPRRV